MTKKQLFASLHIQTCGIPTTILTSESAKVGVSVHMPYLQ